MIFAKQAKSFTKLKITIKNKGGKMKTFVPRWEVLDALFGHIREGKLMDYQLDDGKTVELQTDGNLCWYVDEEGEMVYAAWG